jgi:TolB protein
VALHDHYVDWSPDGKTIAVSSAREDTRRLRLIDIDTLEIVQITEGDNLDGMFGLSWSPDGEHIVFTSNRDGQIPDASGLYVLDVESRKVSALTNPR